MSLMRNPSGGSLEAAVAAISTGIYSNGREGRRGEGQRHTPDHIEYYRDKFTRGLFKMA